MKKALAILAVMGCMVWCLTGCIKSSQVSSQDPTPSAASTQATASTSTATSSSSAAPAESTSQGSSPTVFDIANDASQWITGAEAGTAVACQSGVMNSTECSEASAAANLANVVLSAFTGNPTSQAQQALATAMQPVYSNAIAANSASGTSALPAAAN